MPGRITKSDRTLFILIGVVVILLAIVSIASYAAPEEFSTVPTTSSTGDRGSRAALLLLQSYRYDVQIGADKLADLLPASGASMLILAEPVEAPTAADRTALDEFVKAGHTVLFCGASIPAFFPGASVRPPVDEPEGSQFDAALPTSITRAADRIEMIPETYWKDFSPSQVALYANEKDAAVVSWKLGKGQVIWWASAFPLTNTGLKQVSNLNFFLNTIGAFTRQGRQRILWDEYFHGQRRSLSSYAFNSPLPWAAAQLLLVGALIVFTFGRRSGPIVNPRSPSRLSPLEFVETMGDLYQHANANSIPVEVSWRSVRLDLFRRLGLPLSTSDSDLARIASLRLGFEEAGMRETLQQARTAALTPFQSKLSAARALEIVQALEAYRIKPTIRGTN